MPEVTHTNTPASDTRRVLVLVPNDADTGVAFDRALELAAPDGVIVLFDRSHESWRPDDEAGLHEASDSAYDDMDGMAAARAGAEAGKTKLLVWQSVSPAVGTAILDVLQHADITDIVLPDEGQGSTSSDAVLGDDSSLASAVRSVLAKPLSQDAGVHPELHLTAPAADDQ